MAAPDSVLGQVQGVPADAPVEELDVRDLPPPEPMTETFERLSSLAEDVVLLQRNDRAPEFLYPKLGERGFEYETIEREDAVYTAIWHGDG